MQKIKEAKFQSLGQEDTLEQEMATHSHILDWKIPWTRGVCRLESTELQRVKTRLSN